MDAEIIASCLIEKLQNESTISNAISKKHVQTAIDTLHLLKRFLKHAEDNEALHGQSTNDQKMSRLLQAVYAVENAIDTLLIRREVQRKREELLRERKELRREIKSLRRKIEESEKNHEAEFQQANERLPRESEELLSETEELQMEMEEIRVSLRRARKKSLKMVFILFAPLCSRILFTHEMKKLKNEVRTLSFHDKDARLSFQNDIEGGVGNNNNTNSIFEIYRGSQSQRQRWERISDFYLEESDVVGLGHQINELVVRLIPEHDCNDIGQSSEDIVEVHEGDKGQSTQVIVVSGDGGSGKTTLATMVYNRVDVKQHFRMLSWVQVSSVFKARDVFIDILKQIHPDGFFLDVTHSEEELMWMLIERLEGTRYLIVIDNVETPQVWPDLRDVFCRSSHGSRLIIITRCTSNIPLEAGYSILSVSRLNNEKSWELFSKKVQIAEDDLNNSELVRLKEQILKLCGGLPLLVLLLGGLLSTKERSYHEWSKVIERANDIGEDILALSYQDLRSQVKSCFLYLVLFPRAFEIPVRRLIHLWCAEEFAKLFGPHDPELDPEDVAEMYFEELVIRNLIQVSKWRLNGGPKSCCISSLLYDAFSKKASDLGFVYNQLHSSEPQFVVRRLAVYLGVKNLPSSILNHVLNIRSFVAFDTQMRGSYAREVELFLNKAVGNRGFALLKALDLEGVYKPRIHLVVDKLFQLRYLGLRSTFLDDFVPSLGDLPCLETLDFKHNRLPNIRLLLQNIKKLKHLYMSWVNALVDDLLESLTNLRTLWGLSLRDDFCVENILNKLTRLRKLGLKFDTTCKKSIIEWVSQLTKLQSLKLRCLNDNDESLVFLTMAEHHKLQDLYLQGRLVPEKSEIFKVDFFPPNLRTLTLSLSRLSYDPMAVLGQLPHLNILRLFGDSYLGEEIKCLHGGFPKLRVLKLWKLQARSWIVEEGAMACLKELEIRSCTDLSSIQGLQNVTTLKEIALTNMQQDFHHLLPKDANVYIKINEWDSSRWPIKELLKYSGDIQSDPFEENN